MYRKDVFEAKGITMPDNPTWQQVADIAAKVDGAQPNMKGICLRGQPGWGQVFAPLTTVVNTFGGTWFDKDWTAKVNAPEFKEATNFYVNLVKAHGENGAPQAGFTECLNAMSRATSRCGTTRPPRRARSRPTDSPVKGKIGYVAAPVVKTTGVRLALHLGLGHPEGQQEAGERVEVHLLGLEQGLREARGPAAGLVEGARRASAPRPTPTPTT